MATHREDRTACSACPIPSDWWWKACSLRHSTLHGLIVSSDAFRPVRLAASSSQFGRHYRWDPPIQNQIPPTRVEMVISMVDGRCQDHNCGYPCLLVLIPVCLGSVCLSACVNIYNVFVPLLYNPFLSLHSSLWVCFGAQFLCDSLISPALVTISILGLPGFFPLYNRYKSTTSPCFLSIVSFLHVFICVSYMYRHLLSLSFILPH